MLSVCAHVYVVCGFVDLEIKFQNKSQIKWSLKIMKTLENFEYFN